MPHCTHVERKAPVRFGFASENLEKCRTGIAPASAAAFLVLSRRVQPHARIGPRHTEPSQKSPSWYRHPRGFVGGFTRPVAFDGHHAKSLVVCLRTFGKHWRNELIQAPAPHQVGHDSSIVSQRKKSWDMYQVRLLRCGILPSSLRVLLLLLVSLAGLPLLASCFCVVLLRIRGFCDLI